MALACLGQVKSRVKGHHVYDHNYKVKEKLECFHIKRIKDVFLQRSVCLIHV